MWFRRRLRRHRQVIPPGNPLYVNATTGDDARSKAQARNSSSPWASIHRAYKGAAPGGGTVSSAAADAGDTIIVTDTTSAYNCYALNQNGFGGVALEPVNNGSVGAPIRLQAADNAANKIKIQWGDTNRGAVLGGNTKSYLEYSGLILDETLLPPSIYDAPGNWSQASMVWLADCDHCLVERSKFTGLNVPSTEGINPNRTHDNYSAIRLHGSTGVGWSDITIRDCHFTDWGVVSGGSHNNAGILWYFPGGAITVEYCLFENSGNGMYWKGGSSTNNLVAATVRNSHFRGNHINMALFVGAKGSSASPSMVYQNIMEAPVETCIKMSNLGSELPSHVKFVNNVICGGDYPVGIWGSWSAEGPLGFEFHNNIIRGGNFQRAYRDDAGGFSTTDLVATDFDFANNVYTNCDPDVFVNLGANLSFSSWQGTYGYDTGGVLSTQTIFTNYAGQDFTLASSSPAIGVGRAKFGIGGTADAQINAGAYITGSETFGPRY